MPPFDPDKFAEMATLVTKHTSPAFHESAADLAFLSIKVTCFLLKRDRLRAETITVLTETSVVLTQYLNEICAVIERYEDTPELIEDLVFQYWTRNNASQLDAAREAAKQLRDI